MLNLEKARREAELMQAKINAGEARDHREAEDVLLRERIGKLAELKIGPAQKASLILVLLGLKPAAELYLYPRNDPKETVFGALGEAGLYCEEKNISGQKNVAAILAVSSDEKCLADLVKYNPDKDHEEYGRLMGYPRSAIMAFTEKQGLLDEKEYPDMSGIVFGMKLSRDNWQAETGLLRRWSEAILKYAPDLYMKLKGRE